MRKILRYIFIFLTMCTTTTFCCAQSLVWLQGRWQGKAYFASSDATQHYNLTLTIFNISGNKFEGIISVIQPSDTSIRFDSKISGAVYEKYLVIKRNKVLYVKNPKDAEWKISCNNCSPPQMVFSIERGKFFFRGQQGDCYKECNGINEFSKDTTEFDSSQKEAVYALINGKQKNKPDEALVQNDKPASQDLIAQTSEENSLSMQRILLIPAGTLIETKRNTASLLSGKVSASLHKSLSITTLENTPQTQRIPISSGDTIAFVKRNVALQSTQKVLLYLQRKTSFLIIKESTPITTRIPVLPADVALLKHKNDLLPRKRYLTRTTTLAIGKDMPIVVEIPVTADTISVSKNTTALQPPVLRRDTVVSLPVDYIERKKNVIRTIVVNTDSIVLRVFDNGVVDGDIVSVVYNDKVVIDKLSLTGRAITVKIAVTGTGINTLVFHAHNLGEFPPNTAKLEILCGNKKEELTVSSDLTVSSTINVVYHD